MVHYPRALICLSLYFICCAVASHSDSVSRYKGKYGFNSGDYEIVVPRKVNENGEFISHSIPHHYSDGENSNLYYTVAISGDDHHLELLPNHKILSPGVLVETYNTSQGLLPNKLKRFSDNQCHFTGSVKGHENSRAAISTCHGLAGYIRTERGHYLIEPTDRPITGNPHPHLIYKDVDKAEQSCETGDFFMKRDSNLTLNNSDVPAEMYIETLVVLDQSILNYHKEIDMENFVLTVFNMAHDIFHDSTLNYNINLAIVRLIRLEVEDHEMNIASNRNPIKTLEYFRKWQNKINPKDDSHPNHHDVAVLLTRIDICGDDKNCGLLGAAKLGGLCDPTNQAVICQDNGLRMGFTIAHEIGHSLGMYHDIVNATDFCTLTAVMSPFITPQMSHWSNCSKYFLKNFVDSGLGTCMYDPPTDHSFVLVDVLPGVMYDADYQCKELFGPNAALCLTGLECDNLICYVEDKGCVESHMQPADGTNCGENKWCFHRECVEMGERPAAVDGGWGPWSEWSECTRTCGSGVASQVRYCDKPSPSGGGKYCAGEYRRHRICSTEPCDLEQPSFRDIQCGEFNSWVYPEDGKVHQWKSYLVHDENPCALYCMNDEGSIASLRPRVIDGTTCFRGIHDICINGICKKIPCDLDLQSNAVEDRCGVCKGDGTTCKVVRGEKLFLCEPGLGEQKYVDIPEEAINIKIEELTPSESKIEIRDKEGNHTFISGDELGTFNVKGTPAWVGMIRPKQEAISIPGPIGQPISIWIGVLQNSTIKYSYGTKDTSKRKPKFNWDYLEWSRCSSECGPGTQEAIPKCVEKEAGLVDEMYCDNIPKLKEQLRSCEIAPCTAKWFVGDWGECSFCPWGSRSRIVKCFRPVGNGEGELNFVSDSHCSLPKPKTTESCPCRNKDDEPANATTPKAIEDFMNIQDVNLLVHTDFTGNKFPEGLPHPKKANESIYTIQDKEAMRFLNVMQKDFENNKTRI